MTLFTILFWYLLGVVIAYISLGFSNYINRNSPHYTPDTGAVAFLSWLTMVIFIIYMIFEYKWSRLIPDPINIFYFLERKIKSIKRKPKDQQEDEEFTEICKKEPYYNDEFIRWLTRNFVSSVEKNTWSDDKGNNYTLYHLYNHWKYFN